MWTEWLTPTVSAGKPQPHSTSMGNSTGWLYRGEGRWIDRETICNGLWLIENLAVNFPSNASFVVVASSSCTRQQGLRGPVCLWESPGSPRAFVLKCIQKKRRGRAFAQTPSTAALFSPCPPYLFAIHRLLACRSCFGPASSEWISCRLLWLLSRGWSFTAIRCARDEDGCVYGWDGGWTCCTAIRQLLWIL